MARKLEQLLTDGMTHRKLSDQARDIAAKFNVEYMTDAGLEHIGVGAAKRSPDDIDQDSQNAVRRRTYIAHALDVFESANRESSMDW